MLFPVRFVLLYGSSTISQNPLFYQLNSAVHRTNHQTANKNSKFKKPKF